MKQRMLMANGIMMKEVNRQCPMTTSQYKHSKPPYLTHDLVIQQWNRDYSYMKAKKYKNEDDWNIAKFLRNQTNKNIRRAKANYIK